MSLDSSELSSPLESASTSGNSSSIIEGTRISYDLLESIPKLQEYERFRRLNLNDSKEELIQLDEKSLLKIYSPKYILKSSKESLLYVMKLNDEPYTYVNFFFHLY
jgi:hypothetical protein